MTTTSSGPAAATARATRSCLAMVAVVVALAVDGGGSHEASASNYEAGLITKEFCQSDVFNPSCLQKKGAILILSAKLGRMRPGRCITGSYGHLGCFSDVTIFLGSLCNGRPSCSVHVTDSNLHSSLTCPKDLASFLEVKYVCLAIGNWFHNSTSCSDNDSIEIPVPEARTSADGFHGEEDPIRNLVHPSPTGSSKVNPSLPVVVDVSLETSRQVAYSHLEDERGSSRLHPGYISSHVASSLGSIACPLKFIARPGLRIRITLLAFGGLVAGRGTKDYKIEVRHRTRSDVSQGYRRHKTIRDRSNWSCYHVASVVEESSCQVDVCVSSLVGVIMNSRHYESSENVTREHRGRTNTSNHVTNKHLLMYSSSKNFVQFFFTESSTLSTSSMTSFINDDDFDGGEDDDGRGRNEWVTLAYYEAHSCSPDAREASDTLHCADAEGETPPSSILDSGFSKDESASTDKESHSIPLGLLLVVAIGVSLGVFTGGLLLSILSVFARSNKKKTRECKGLKLEDRTLNADDFLSLERHVISGKMAASSLDHFHFLIEDSHLDESHKMATAAPSSSACCRADVPEEESDVHLFPVTCSYDTDGRVVASLGDRSVTKMRAAEERDTRGALETSQRLMASQGNSRCGYCFPDVLH